MAKKSTSEAALETLLSTDPDLKLTPLRKDVLEIFIRENKALSAYELLDKLKSKRSNAQPPTVYRVLEYFIEKNIVHRFHSENKFKLCNHLDHHHPAHQSFVFICKKCHTSKETSEKKIGERLKKLAMNEQFLISQPLIEVSGLCQKCAD